MRLEKSQENIVARKPDVEGRREGVSVVGERTEIGSTDCSK